MSTTTSRPASRPVLGCIADDFTGATDLANMLVRAGMRTVQTIGIPQEGHAGDADIAADADAIVVALKSRTIPAADAVQQSLAALRWLQAQGCSRFFFKYCSTFDSTDDGNIGPVAEALMTALGTDFTLACPAFPENGRTIFRGHLFVGDVLLNASGMEHHPLTPMRDPNLVPVLARQSQGKVGLLRYDAVMRGAQAARDQAQRLRADGVKLAIADAISNDDLIVLGEAFADLPLLTGARVWRWACRRNIAARGSSPSMATLRNCPPWRNRPSCSRAAARARRTRRWRTGVCRARRSRLIRWRWPKGSRWWWMRSISCNAMPASRS